MLFVARMVRKRTNNRGDGDDDKLKKSKTLRGVEGKPILPPIPAVEEPSVNNREEILPVVTPETHVGRYTTDSIGRVSAPDYNNRATKVGVLSNTIPVNKEQFDFAETTGLDLEDIRTAANLAQLASYIPLPPAQIIGKAGNVVSAGFDIYDLYKAKQEGDEEKLREATTSLASNFIPVPMVRTPVRRRLMSWVTGQPLLRSKTLVPDTFYREAVQLQDTLEDNKENLTNLMERKVGTNNDNHFVQQYKSGGKVFSMEEFSKRYAEFERYYEMLQNGIDLEQPEGVNVFQDGGSQPIPKNKFGRRFDPNATCSDPITAVAAFNANNNNAFGVNNNNMTLKAANYYSRYPNQLPSSGYNMQTVPQKVSYASNAPQNVLPVVDSNSVSTPALTQSVMSAPSVTKKQVTARPVVRSHSRSAFKPVTPISVTNIVSTAPQIAPQVTFRPDSQPTTQLVEQSVSQPFENSLTRSFSSFSKKVNSEDYLNGLLDKQAKYDDLYNFFTGNNIPIEGDPSSELSNNSNLSSSPVVETPSVQPAAENVVSNPVVNAAIDNSIFGLDNSRSQYDENGNPVTIWKNGDDVATNTPIDNSIFGLNNSYSKYDENGNPVTVWKNGDEGEYNKLRERENNQVERPDVNYQLGTLLDIAGADVSTEGALFQLGRSLNFNADKFAPEYKNIARAGNIVAGVGALGKTVLSGIRNINAGMGYQNRLQNFKEYYDKKEAERAKGHYQTAENGGLIYMKDGGNIPPEMLLSGDYTTGVRGGMPANAEVENGEYLQHNDGSVQQVLGRSHENGGEPMMLEPGTRVVSDNLKIGKDLSEDINTTFGLKTKASDTYASVVDKFKKKNDIDDLEKQEQELLKKAEKNEEVESVATRSLNKEYLSKRLNDLKDKKLQAQEMLSQFTDFVFNAQQAAKGESAEMGSPEIPQQGMSPEDMQMMVQESAMQEGAASVSDQDVMMEDGGLFEDLRFKELVRSSGLDENRARELYRVFRNGGYAGLPVFADGGTNPKRETKHFRPEEILEAAKKDPELAAYYAKVFKTIDINPYALIERDRQHLNSKTGVYGGIDNSMQARLKFYYDHNNDIRRFFNKKDDGTIELKKEFNNLNFQKGFQSDFVKQAERLKALGYYGDKEYQDVMDYISFIEGNDTARGFDNKMGDFTSSRSFLAIPILKDENEYDIVKKNNIYSLKQLVEREPELEKLGISKETLERVKKELKDNGDLDLGLTYLDPVTEKPAPPAEPDGEPKTPVDEKGVPVTFDEKTKKRRSYGNLSGLLFPDQTPLPPDGVGAHLMVDRNYERLDPIKVSYEPQMVESQRMYNAAADSVANLPETQRAAVMANMMASTQQGLNNVIGQTALANQQNEMQTEQFNIQQSNNEENARAEDLLSFEQRQLMAWENTLRDYNDWFEKIRQNRMLERQTQNQVALINELNDNYKYDINGRLVAVDNGEKFRVNNLAPVMTKEQVELQKKQSEAELAEAKTKTEHAKNYAYLGRKFNR